MRGTNIPPLLFVLAAALLWSTGGLFIKWTDLSGFELSFGRSLFAAITVAVFTRHEGFGLNRLTAVASVLYAVLLLLFVLATKQTTAANAITRTLASSFHASTASGLIRVAALPLFLIYEITPKTI